MKEQIKDISKLKIPSIYDYIIKPRSLEKAQINTDNNKEAVIWVYRNVILQGYISLLAHLTAQHNKIKVLSINKEEFFKFYEENRKERVNLRKTVSAVQLVELVTYAETNEKIVNDGNRDSELIKQNNLCYICGREMKLITGNETRQSNLDRTFDHILPKSRYKTTPENKAYCCRQCNQIKRDIRYSVELADLIRAEYKVGYKEQIPIKNEIILQLNVIPRKNIVYNTCLICGNDIKNKKKRKSICSKCTNIITGFKLLSWELIDIARLELIDRQMKINREPKVIKEITYESRQQIIERLENLSKNKEQ